MYVSENIIPACILHLPKKCTFYKSDVIKIPDIFNQSFRETDFWLRMSCLICDAGLFMFQSRSQWQFIWWTHKKAKYQPAARQGRLFLGIRGWVDVWRLVVSIFTECKVWGWRQSVVLTPGGVWGVCRGQTTVTARRDSVGVRSVRAVHHSSVTRVSRDPSRVIKFWSPAFWWLVTVVKCDSNSLKLSSISLAGCDKRNSPIKLFLTSEWIGNIKQWGQLQCLSVTRDIDNTLRERRASIRSDLYQWRDFMAPL